MIQIIYFYQNYPLAFRVYSKIILALCILTPLGFAAYWYPSLPNTIPVHFNSSGEADNWGPRGMIFLSPAILGFVSLVVYLLLTNIRRIDPKRYFREENGVFNAFALFIVAFLCLLSLCVLWVTVHTNSKIERLLYPAIGLAFLGMGFFLPRLRQNYFAGFKLPWTLDNEANWDATHRMAGTLWRWGGLLQVLSGLFFEESLAFGLFIGLAALMVILPVIFSFRMFQRSRA